MDGEIASGMDGLMDGWMNHRTTRIRVYILYDIC